nr:unnamed protein product [Haemonchus contortus]
MLGVHLNTAGSDETSTPSLVFLDQTLIVFDVEQRKNASQVLHISRVPKIGLVSYRFQEGKKSPFYRYLQSEVLTI